MRRQAPHPGHEVLIRDDGNKCPSLRHRPPSRAERFKRGRSLRQQVPRSSLGERRVGAKLERIDTEVLITRIRLRNVVVEGWAPLDAAVAGDREGRRRRVEVLPRDLARQPLSAKELAGFAVIVLDPPHAGASAQIAQVAASRAATIIYVSCNPSSLARDARTLQAAGYKLAKATGIDQFLWSARLESVCVFRRP